MWSGGPAIHGACAWSVLVVVGWMLGAGAARAQDDAPTEPSAIEENADAVPPEVVEAPPALEDTTVDAPAADDATVEEAPPVAEVVTVDAAVVPPPPTDLFLLVRAEGHPTDWRLHVRERESDPWFEVCTLPCWVTPEPGPWHIGVTMGRSRAPSEVLHSPIDLQHNGVLSVRHHSRLARHVGGGIMIALGLAGAIVSGVLMANSLFPEILALPVLGSLMFAGGGVLVAFPRNYLTITWSPR